MPAGLSENELRDSNGLSPNNEGKMNTSEEKGDFIEDVEDKSSLFAALEMDPYLFDYVAAIGSEGALEEDKERRFKD